MSTRVTVDIACDFLSWPRLLKALIFGLERGDPSVYKSVNTLKNDLEIFLREWEWLYSEFSFEKEKLNDYLKSLNISYINQDAFPMAENIFIKVKRFMYGKRLSKFFPIEKTRGCLNRNVGILASGNAVPCCLIYDDSVSLGNVNENELSDILENSREFLEQLRQGTNMPLTCRRCLGAPTKRGVVLKEINTQLRKFIR